MKVTLSEDKINEFLRRSRLSMEEKQEIVELVLNEPGISTNAIARKVGVPLPSVRIGLGYMGIGGRENAAVRREVRLEAGEKELIEKVRVGFAAGRSGREIAAELGIPEHRVQYIKKREGIVKVKVEKHGRATDYNEGCRCAVCTEAHRVRMAEVRQSRLERREDIPHGTESGYVNWGCRCGACRPVGLAKLRERTTVPAEGMVRLGALWNGAEIGTIESYGVTARDHALALGRSVHGVNAARNNRGIKRKTSV